MSASKGDADTPIRKFQGFQTYADDTPRGAAPEDVRPEARSWTAAPWDEVDAERFEDPAPSPGPEIPRAPRRAVPGALIAVGVALAAAAGIYVAREQPAAPRGGAPEPAAVSTPGSQMNVEVATAAETPPPPPPTATSDRLEVLESPEAAPGRDAPSTIRTYPQAPVPPRRLEITPPRPAAPPEPPAAREPRVFGAAARVPDTAAVAPPPRAWSDCRDAPTLAVSMVCADRALASLDRRMKQAYAAALDAGAPPDLLREDQADWLDVREEAAQVSREAVADIYRQRIGELRRAARE